MAGAAAGGGSLQLVSDQSPIGSPRKAVGACRRRYPYLIMYYYQGNVYA
ncbi:hypothetical protein LT85_p033 (plasmid) [Collimonas arenae]|uniref:Uncharacterized protein n=1 Tax=Collimonas arenae TaxID=279058 RepID=A0A0A1FMN4_9BURK|nr:hypothetical protein LT85_p033 [Collimonas arenae]